MPARSAELGPTGCGPRPRAAGPRPAVPVIRVDVEGIGDAGGDGSAYRESDDPFYAEKLIQQARSVLDLAVERGLPDRFALGGLCSGGFWAFQAALSDVRVQSVIMLNPRLLFFDAQATPGASFESCGES